MGIAPTFLTDLLNAAIEKIPEDFPFGLMNPDLAVLFDFYKPNQKHWNKNIVCHFKTFRGT